MAHDCHDPVWHDDSPPWRPPEGWSEPDARGHITFTMYGRVNEDAPPRDGYEAYFVGVHGTDYTRWVYRPI